jgi:hypothetical protein
MNPKPKKRLITNELKSYPRFENYTDETAEETIASLETLSILLYEHYQKKNSREIKIVFSKKSYVTVRFCQLTSKLVEYNIPLSKKLFYL